MRRSFNLHRLRRDLLASDATEVAPSPPPSPAPTPAVARTFKTSSALADFLARNTKRAWQVELVHARKECSPRECLCHPTYLVSEAPSGYRTPMIEEVLNGG